MSKKFLLLNCFAFLFFFSISHIKASTTAEIDRKTVSMGETINLLLKVKDQDANNIAPNFEPLTTDFKIVNSSEQTQIQILNGKASTLKQWTIALEPKEVGSFLIPAIQIGGVLTEPLRVEVVPASEFKDDGELKEVFINTVVKPENPYVSSQAIYTIQVFYRADIQNGQLSEPIVEDGTIKQIGQDSNYQKNLGGRTYHVLERNYAVVADKSGELKIHPPVLSGYIKKNDSQRRTGMIHWMNSILEPIRISANPITLNIKPIPEGISLTDWLPAEFLSIQEDWSLPARQIQLGQPITRTITIQAGGITAEKLPEINHIESSDALIYPDKPQLENDSNEKNLIAKRIEKLAIIPTKIGEILLPPIDIKWWNINTNQFEIASLPAQTLQIVAPSGTNSINSAFSDSTPPSEKNLIAAEDHLSINKTDLFTNERYIWIGIILALILGWGISLHFWRQSPVNSSKEKFNPSDETLKECKRQFRKFALKNDPNESKHFLIKWAKLFWSDQTIRTLGDVEKHLHNAEAKKLIRELDKSIYTNQTDGWIGKPLWEKLEKEMLEIKTKDSLPAGELPSLYLNQ